MLVADDGTVKVHSVVLAASSSRFKSELTGFGDLTNEKVITVAGMPLYILQVAVRLMYSGELIVPLQYSSSEHVLQIITSLQELGLKLPLLQIRWVQF